LPRVFEAGFTTRPGSTGLGLAVCRRILEQHGGSIAAESKAGHGATFRVRLPAAAPTVGPIAELMMQDSAEAAGSATTGVHS
jgi:signal transduction histidine kinase